MVRCLQNLFKNIFEKLSRTAPIHVASCSYKMETQAKMVKKRKHLFTLLALKNFTFRPDINPIENIFNFAKAQIQADALQRNINKESFEQYSKRVKHTLENLSIDYITKTIGSMDKRG